MREDFLKKIGPLGSALIIFLSAIGIALAFTFDFGVPERYESQYDTAYYIQSVETMEELHEELKTFVFPALGGIVNSNLSADSNRIVIYIETAYYDRTIAALLRDFDGILFEFEAQ
jgi:hypothetical protein